MIYFVIDDGQQPRCWPCTSNAQMQKLALPANAKGFKMYGFPSEEEARRAFPGLVMEQHPTARAGCGAAKAAVLLLVAAWTLLGGSPPWG